MPLELRNRIYEYTATKLATEKYCFLPSYSLTQTCRELRAEYLPICLKAPVEIDWDDVPNYLTLIFRSPEGRRYLGQLFPTLEGEVNPQRDIAPSSMTIVVPTTERDDWERLEPTEMIDVLPIIRLRHRNAGFRCTFAMSPEHSLEELKYIRGDIKVLEAFINHDGQVWRDEVSSGKVVYVPIANLGAEESPYVHILLNDENDEETYLKYSEVDNDVDSNDEDWKYLRKVGLGDIWKHEVDGEKLGIGPIVRRWNVEETDEVPDRDRYALGRRI